MPFILYLLPRHAGYVEQPQKLPLTSRLLWPPAIRPLRTVRLTITLPQSGHIGGTSLDSKR